jgi:hypothetical protein
MERLSNNLNRVVRLTNWNEPIAEGYFPKLDNILANRVWSPRPANAVLTVIFEFNICYMTLNTILLLYYTFF